MKYSNTMADTAGSTCTNCITADPLFANPTSSDFHLKSLSGRWNGTAWVTDTVTSPAIDAGDPASLYSLEPAPNGGRINMGAYGNTIEASKSGAATSVSDPVFSPVQGTYTSTQLVSISSATAGATIYYTTNGTTPTTSSSIYSTPITVSSTTTIEALAVKSGLTNSAVTTAIYTISVPVLTSITVSPSTASITIGSTQQFTATPKDQNGNTMTGITISWISSNTGVATINFSGLATAIALGSATITASSGSVSATAALTVSTLTSPTFINEYETAWNSTTSPKTTSAFDVQSGDVLVVYAMTENAATSVSISGGSLTWTQQQVVNISQYTWLSIWTATADTSKNMSVTFTRSATANNFGGNVLLFRNASIGASSKTNVLSGAPTLNLTTTQANSAIIVASSDWSALDGATRAWRTNAGAFTEKTYATVSSAYTVYGGYHSNAGPINTYAVGLTAPAGQKYSLAAIEIKGSVSSDTTPPAISISSPANNQTFANSSITVSGAASDNISLTKVEVKLNAGTLQLAAGTTSWSLPLTLISGSNTITARATDSSNNIQETNITVTYTPITTGTISGTISNSSSVPIQGATVSDGTRSAITDVSGNYAISNVPAGTYTLTASSSGYTTQSKSAIVSVAQTTTVNFTLLPPLSADLNTPPDGYVNAQDFAILLSSWNSAAKPPADINQDGFVNSVDFGIMMAQWG